MSRGTEEMAALPMLSAPVDQMRVGINTMEGSYGSSQHNLQKQLSDDRSWIRKLESTRRVYGSHMAMRLATEREIFGKSQLGDLRCSRIGLLTMQGMDERIGFEDFLNDPLQRPEMPMLTVHSQMEVQLGIL
eukprot:gene24060-31250_t